MPTAKEEDLPLGVVVPYPFVPSVGGGQLVNYRLTKAFAERYPSIVLSSEGNEKTEGLVLHSLFRYVKLNYINPLLAWRFFSFLRKNKVRALFVNHPFLGLVLYPAKKYLDIPFYLYQHNIEYLRFKSLGKWTAFLLFYLEKFTCRYADALFFISEEEIKKAVDLYGLDRSKCHFLPHFLNREQAPEHRQEVRAKFLKKHGFQKGDWILLFFGPLDYAPNAEAVDFIVQELYPQLNSEKRNIQILICGGGMDEAKQALLEHKQNIHYLGFVENIEDYVQTADIALVPLFRGGGVKTKVIEALEWGTTVLTTPIGAEGIARATCKNKLIVLEDKGAFAETILALKEKPYEETPTTFYEFYHIDKVLKSAMDVMDL